MKLRVYAVFLWLLAISGLAWTVLEHQRIDFSVVLVLGTLSLLADWLAFEIPYGATVSLGFVFAYAAVLLGGPLNAAAVALFLAVTPQDLAAHKSPTRMAVNGAQLLLSVLVSAWLYLSMGGVPLLDAAAGQMGIAGWLLPALVAGPVQAAVNMILVAVAMSLVSGLPLRRVWILGFRSYVVSVVPLIILGLMLAQLVVIGGYWSLVLLLVPFLVARQTFRVYQEQADAYRNTLRSLISALEAKDTYTRGHSERVARFARGIAEELGLSDAAIQDVEWAALLHDIGKIAIDTSTLRKPGALTPQEYQQVQGHPRLAAETLADIEFLEDILPLISAHHERMDGNGYPDGLGAAEIALGARILAVADCFDAMTSDRSYREAMDPRAAAEDLVRSSGTQLDPRCVRAFLLWARREIGVDTTGLEVS